MTTVFRMIAIVIAAMLSISGVGSGNGKPDNSFFGDNTDDYRTITVDAGSVTGQMTHKATGFLYGFAEPDVPSENTLAAIGVYTAVAKPKAGLQHPMGDVTQVYETFFEAGGEYLQVYCQDKIDTWYYQPPAGGLTAYYEMLREIVTDINESVAPEYKSRIVYYPFNEPDGGGVNTGWFSNSNFSAEYNVAYKTCYDIIKSINPEAKVGGPNFQGYTDNNANQMQTFMTYCRDNNCLPDVVSWHELAEVNQGIDSFSTHYAQFRALEQSLGIEPIEVCITEYGAKSSNAMPSNSLKWITVFEQNDAAGCRAYWRTANNMNDLTGDYNSPNADWWVYKWYADMVGEELSVNSTDNSVLRAVASRNTDSKTVEVLYAGAQNDGDGAAVTVQNLSSVFGNVQKVHMKVEAVDFVGLTGEELEPNLLFDGDVQVEGNTVRWADTITTTGAYRVTLTEADGGTVYENPYRPIRVEVEAGTNMIEMPTNSTTGGDKWNGNYTSYAKSNGSYCTSGKSLPGTNSTLPYQDTTFEYVDVTYHVTVPVSGIYKCDFVYSNQHKAANGDRAPVKMTVQWNGGETTDIMLENTYTVAYMDMATDYRYIPKGEYTIKTTVTTYDGTQIGLYDIGMDFMRLTPVDTTTTSVEDYETRKITLSSEPKREATDGDKFMLVLSEGGYYTMTTDQTGSATLLLDNTAVGEVDLAAASTVYLRKGVNYLEFADGALPQTITLQKNTQKAATEVPANAETVTLAGNARLVENSYSPTGYNIGNLGGNGKDSATFGFNVPRSGWYRITLSYANDQCFGNHDYNPQQIDRYASIIVNGENLGKAYFRNTQSWNYYSEKTLTVYCISGYNELTVVNDGSYVWWGEGDSVTISSGATMSKADIYAPDFAGITVAAALS